MMMVHDSTDDDDSDDEVSCTLPESFPTPQFAIYFKLVQKSLMVFRVEKIKTKLFW
jgi:uncharacterized protein YcgL (UPF0745 family)